MHPFNNVPSASESDIINFLSDPRADLSLRKQLRQLSTSNGSYKSSIMQQSEYIIIRLWYPAQTTSYNYITDNKMISFLIVISKGYPLSAPSVHLIDCLTNPGFNDCRDLLYQILDQNWDPLKMALRYIVSQIKQYLSNLYISEDIYHVARIGTFHINHYYSATIIKILHPKQWIIGFEISEDKIKMLLIVVTNTHFLVFMTLEQPTLDKDKKKYIISSQNDIKLCRLIFQAEVGCLTQIWSCKPDFNMVQITFSTKKTYNMHLTQKPIKWKLRCRKGSNLIQKLIKTMKNYNPTQIKLDLDPSHITENQSALLKTVNDNQKQIHSKFNRQTIRKLNLSYQSVVEYYSSQNNPYYEIFMDKIMRLNIRDDVRLIMEVCLSPTTKLSNKTEKNEKKNEKNEKNEKNKEHIKKEIKSVPYQQEQLYSEQIVKVIPIFGAQQQDEQLTEINTKN